MKNTTCIYQDQEYLAIGDLLFGKIYSIPEEFGVFPDWGGGTDAYRAIGAALQVEGDSLIVRDLWLYATDDRYLPIHGVQPTFKGPRSYALYSALNTKVEGDGQLFLVRKQVWCLGDISGYSGPFDYEEVLELTIENGAIAKITNRSVEAAEERLKRGPSPLETEIAAQVAVFETPKAVWRKLMDWVNASTDPDMQRDLHLVTILCRRKSFCPTGREALKIVRLKDRAEASGFSAQKSRTRRRAVENSSEESAAMPDTARDINMLNDSQDHWHTFDFSTPEAIEKQGFAGKIKIADWGKEDEPHPDNAKGIYLIVWNKRSIVHFDGIGTGGHFKKKDPNVKTEILEKSWIPETCVLYIGKAAAKKNGLRGRLNQYMRFGDGKSSPHSGGRYIWQLRERGELLIYWKELPNEEPRDVERLLLQEFKKQYGRLPFANLKT
jgi:hypothetical protein